MEDEYGMDAHDVAERFERDDWHFTDAVRQFKCGFCGTVVAPQVGMMRMVVSRSKAYLQGSTSLRLGMRING